MKFTGIVEVHNNNQVSGWCYNTEDRLNSTKVSIYAADILLRTINCSTHREDILRGHNAPSSGFLLHLSKELQKLIPKNTILSVRDVNGCELKHYKPENTSTIGESEDSGEELRQLFAKGYHIDKWGQIKLTFSAMSDTHRYKYAKGIKEISEYFRQRFGLQLFPHYGTLLGYARDKCFLPHDDDTDTSIILMEHNLEDVAERFFDIANTIIQDGHFLDITSTGQMHIKLRGHHHIGCDVFASWFNSDGHFRSFFGVGGAKKLYGMTFFRDTLEGVEIDIPHNYEEILELAYGPNWRIPDTNFQWSTPPHILEEMNILKSLKKEKIGTFNKDVL